MSIIDERTPAALFLTLTEREELNALLAKAERLTAELASAWADVQRTVTATSPITVDLGDPLATYRLPSGAVGYETTYADAVVMGDWVQRCHGDPDWHLVTEVECFTGDDGRPWVKVRIDGTANFWLATDAIRLATPPADVIADQERKAEASR